MKKWWPILVLFSLLCLALGAAFGLAKIGVLPARKWAGEKGALGTVARLSGFRPLKKPVAKTVAAGPPLTAEQLAQQQRVLQAEQRAFEQERAAWEQQKQKAQQAPPATPLPSLDPAQMARLAEIYSKMDAPKVNQILDKLPESEVVLLLQQMDERKVASILEGMAPAKAARITGELAHTPLQSASNSGVNGLSSQNE
ncbi:MotE family protein [Chthonomonas calidirosea]|uniref:MgtE intracellular N domain n=1 Tax=Chthonomonas calidirosea (strain DSM 23976 / ICMP 18418 / T49) TaxID=1303518 RepID=S0EYJ6_CHTCT|nr:MgtE intracellular N domain [Chthonomonas calidirosea]CCW34968.1 MgtE intracellular N domain [Chthonomonas calidirosea T49]CEK12408.1 MgtE intracellular N domain-containing protein [Chthonomonas calidirosea]CEK13277.1 MgtE intracellular N domain-containing protein [Chthonomonas calidirosea]